MALGIGFISEDRKETGLSADLNSKKNITLGALNLAAIIILLIRKRKL